jgi:tRNA(Arg) A34 adenosine deaminase TadA
MMASKENEQRTIMNPNDISYLRTAIEVARQAREHGNHPFGAILVDENYSADILAKCTLYTSTEPCAMCAGAIYWGNVGRVVYALSEVALYEIVGPSPDQLVLSSREVFAHSQRQVEVEGPASELEVEARAVHAGFWR